MFVMSLVYSLIAVIATYFDGIFLKELAKKKIE